MKYGHQSEFNFNPPGINEWKRASQNAKEYQECNDVKIEREERRKDSSNLEVYKCKSATTTDLVMIG